MIALLLMLRVVLNYSPTRLALLGSIFTTERSILLHSKVGILPETAACNRHYELFFVPPFFFISSFLILRGRSRKEIRPMLYPLCIPFFFSFSQPELASISFFARCHFRNSFTKSCPITFMCISAHLSLPTQRMLRKTRT